MLDGEKFWNEEINKGLVDDTIGGKKLRSFHTRCQNMYEVLTLSASVYKSKAMIIDNDFRACTYEEVLDMTDTLSGCLKEKYMISQGDAVAVMGSNCIEFCVSFFALQKIGAVMVPLPSKYKSEEIKNLLSHVDIKLVLTEEACERTVREAVISHRIVIIDYKKLSSYAKGKRKLVQYFTGSNRRESSAMIMFTSGTTSQSKGVEICNYNIIHAVEAYRRILSVTDKDKTVIATPIYHITGIIALLSLFVYCGGTIYLHRTFCAERVLEEIQKNELTFIHASPTVFHMLVSQGAPHMKLPSLRAFACGSSNMAKESLIRVHKWLPNVSFHTVYGLTETSSPAAIFPSDAGSSPYIGSSGYPIPGTKFKIIDENDHELKAGEIGEIAIQGAVVCRRYINKRDAHLEDGWLYTGDMGYFNSSGYLFVVDRKKDMINRGGEKIWCFDVENAISEIPDVKEVAVVGVADTTYGEVPAAAIVSKSGKALSINYLYEHLKDKMSKYKIPVKICMFMELPLTANGKVDKQKIRKILAEDKG